MSTTHQRSFAAEVRAVETGHQAVLLGDGTISVVSDSTPGLHWVVWAFASAAGDGVMFECRPDDPRLAAGRGHGEVRSAVPGAAPCMHCARAARRLERAGLVRWDNGCWTATDRGAALAQPHVDDTADPFDGL